MSFIVISVGCLECEVWSYVCGVAATEKEGRELLTKCAEGRALQDYKEGDDTEFDKIHTCIAYVRGIDRIFELHRTM